MAIITLSHIEEADLVAEQTHSYINDSADGFLFSSATHRDKLRSFNITWTKLEKSKAEVIIDEALSAAQGGNRLFLTGYGVFIPKSDFLSEKWSMETADLIMKVTEVKA